MPFIHLNETGKLVKKAYTAERLKVGNFYDKEDGTRILIATPQMVISITNEHVPNKLKAIITEFIGSVPAELNVTEYGKVNDRQLEIDEAKTLVGLAEGTGSVPFVKTQVTLHDQGHAVRVIQNPKTLQCLGIKEELLNLINPNELNYDIEGDPIGPELTEDLQKAYFYNGTTTLLLAIHTFSDSAKEVLSTLSLLDLNPSNKGGA